MVVGQLLDVDLHCRVRRGGRVRRVLRAVAPVLAATALLIPSAASAHRQNGTGGAQAPRGSQLAVSGPATPRAGSLSPYLGGHGARLRGASRVTGLQLIQRALRLHADGAWGPQSEGALKRWQSAHGLAASAIPTSATLTGLGLDPTYEPPTPPLTAPASDAIRGPASAVSAELRKIALCESTNDPHQLSSGGLYRGLYQFDMESWFRAGGLGDPARAPVAEQTMRAAWILATQGRSAAWPVCS
jgi:transglycosylase-like protein/putative peptidoglycan binding protein